MKTLSCLSLSNMEKIHEGFTDILHEEKIYVQEQ